MWIEGFVAGCSFTQPLHPSVLKIVIEAAKPEPSVVDRRAVHRSMAGDNRTTRGGFRSCYRRGCAGLP
jgi:hypothetical protein